MENTVSIDSIQQGGDVDYQSFIETQKKQSESGLATLTRVESVDKNDVSSETEQYLRCKSEGKSQNSVSDLLRFEAKMDGGDIEVVMLADSDSHWNVIEEWTGENSIERLAGRSIPIREIHNGVYTIAPFDNAYVRRMSDKKEMYDKGLIKYDGNRWITSKKYENYKSSVRRMQMGLNMTSIMSTTIAMLFAVQGMFLIWGILMTFWLTTFLTSIYMRLTDHSSFPNRKLI